MSFDTLGLSAELLRAVREQGYTEPTPIQSKAIPVILQGLDIMAAAQTGIALLWIGVGSEIGRASCRERVLRLV